MIDNLDDDDDIYNLGIENMEAKRDLHRRVADGARVEADLSSDSSLKRYVEARRLHAADALARLVEVDATDSIGIARLQHTVAEYLNVRNWARGVIQDSIAADNALQGNYGDGESTDE